MTVETQVKSVTANGNGAATSFSFSPMVINAASELQVTHLVVATGVETVKTIDVDYSVSVTAYPGTGSITYPLAGSALPAGESLVMKRLLTLEQTTDLENQGGFFPDTLEQQLDKLVMIDLQQQEELDRTIKRKKGDTTLTDEELPNAVSATAGDVLALNSGKTGFSYVTPNSSAYVTAPSSSTDNAIVRFDGTTGKAFQNSGITISDGDIMVNNKQVRWTKGADIASASPLVLGSDGNFFDVTGSTGFSQITCTAGTLFMLQFDGAVALTHGASLILPYAANQTTQAGDRLIGFAEAANTVRVLSYVHATAAAERTALGLVIGTDVLAPANNLSDVASAATSRTNLGLVIGTDVLAPAGSGSSLTGIRKQGLETIWIPAGAMTTRTTNGAASGSSESTTNRVMKKTLDFDTSTQEFAQFMVRFPKSWNEGTVTFAPIWTAASGSGGVVWALQGIALSDDDALDTAYGTEQTSTDTLITALDVHVGPTSSAITIGGTPAVGDWVSFQIKRNVSDGSDTLGVDALLMGVVIFFTTNSSEDT